ncbi:MAG: ATP synthase F1 subunit gamma [Anaerovoracaceae bacterium]|nr:ATP synthase F1 subunit gamma [Bacillota bacterium]MDY2670856.1 ATP synthase F1 subunit gamma [Anaerovoracaceae bacterium]
MASMQEIRTRINSVKDTMKITNAMYLISSSKLRKARNGRDATAPYFDTLQATINDILIRTPELSSQGLFENREKKDKIKRCFIVVSSDKGLAGAYNHNVFKLVDEKIAAAEDNVDPVNQLILVGHMGLTYFKGRDDVEIDEEHIYPCTDPKMYRAREIAEHMIKLFLEDEVDEIYVAYTKMVNSMVFTPKIMRILPLTRGMFEDAPEMNEGLEEPIFTPSPEEVLQHIVPNYVKGLIYGAIVESFACEQSARMTAMDNATTNAKDMIDELSLIYNRVRQAAITQEITEIVSGAQSTN